MIISDPLKMRIHAFGDAAFSLLKEQFEDRTPIRIGNKEFIATNATRNFDGKNTTDCSSEIGEFVRIKAAEWNGEGLPPVGVDVEVCSKYSHPLFDRFIGRKVHIIAHDVINGDPVAVFRMPINGRDPESDQDYHAMVAGSFRPIILTPEQIAAEAKAKELEILERELTYWATSIRQLGAKELADKLMSSGYRKTPATDN